MVKLRHFDHAGTARFVTFNCHRNQPGLSSDVAKTKLLSHLEDIRKTHKFMIFGYVIMPNHVHLVLLPTDGMKLGEVIGEIKSKSARDLLSGLETPDGARRVFWQKL